jgi:hypothetical protein
MSSSIGQKPHLLLSTICDEILSWMIKKLDEKSHGKWQYLQHCKSPINLQGMTNNVELTISVGDTIP